MNMIAAIVPEVKISVTYPLDNGRIFVNETDMVADMVRTAGFNIPTGSGLYILKDPTDNPFLNVSVGHFSSFNFEDNTATFVLDKHAKPEVKKVIDDIMSNPNDYELFAKLSTRINENGYVEFDRRGSSFFFLKNKKYIISKEIKTTEDGGHKAFITWTER